jgi:hypothetical protein
MTTTPVTAILGPFVLPAFTFQVLINGKIFNASVPAGVQVPAGVKATFDMPQVKVTIDSGNVTIDSSTEIDS